MKQKTEDLAIGIFAIGAMWFIGSEVYTANVKRQAEAYTTNLGGTVLDVGGAGIGNIISTTSNIAGATKCDIIPNPNKNIAACDISKFMPYTNKQFDVVFASHVIEHVKPSSVINALNEFERIGKQTVIVIPNTLTHMAVFVPQHKSIIKLLNNNQLHIKNNWIYNKEQEEYIIDLPLSFKVFQ